MVSFHSTRKLSSYLVRAKLYPLLDIGSYNCGKKRCQICQSVVETDSFTSTSTGKTYKINHQFNCTDKCLIDLYLRGQSCLQQHIFEHFNSPGHKGFLDDISITFFDKTDPSDTEKRKDYWIQTLKTAAPWGLNIM